MKKTLLIILVLGSILSAGAYSYLQQPDIEPDIRKVTLSRGDIVDSVGATGTLQAVTTVQVGSQVSGKIQALSADFNSIVRQGDIIAKLDPSLFETQIEQNRANLIRAEADAERLIVSVEDAKKQVTRAEDLAQQKLIPETELDAARLAVLTTEAQLRSAQAQITQAAASLNQAQVNLDHTIITAPIDGIVISRTVDVGQTVAASMQAPILFLLAADLTKMKVDANIDESDVGRIRPGQVVTFRVDAYPNQDFEGAVSQIRLEPIVLNNVVTYTTVIDVPNADLKLKPGMTATVTLEIARRNNVVRIPNAALRFRATADMFTSLGQPIPDQLRRDRGPSSPTPGANSASESASLSSNETNAGRSESGSPGEQPNPEQRQRMMERLQNLSAEEREAAIARFREGRGTRQDRTQSGRPNARRQSTQEPTTLLPATERGAQTIDALFGPLPSVETTGQVWLYAAGTLKGTRLQLGITDGAFTQLLGPDIPTGSELVTNIITGNEGLRGASGGSSSPLMPQRRGFFR